MPEKWLRCYAEMLPRIDAAEHLGHVAEATAADSWIDRHSRQDLLTRWQRQMDGPPDEAKQMTKMEFERQMTAFGLSIEDDGNG